MPKKGNSLKKKIPRPNNQKKVGRGNIRVHLPPITTPVVVPVRTFFVRADFVRADVYVPILSVPMRF